MNLIAYLFGAGGLIVGGLLATGVQELRMAWSSDEIRKEEATKQVRICDGRIAEVKTTLADDALAKVDAANSSLAGLTATPDDPAERQKVCNLETACRDRKVAP